MENADSRPRQLVADRLGRPLVHPVVRGRRLGALAASASTPSAAKSSGSKSAAGADRPHTSQEHLGLVHAGHGRRARLRRLLGRQGSAADRLRLQGRPGLEPQPRRLRERTRRRHFAHRLRRQSLSSPTTRASKIDKPAPSTVLAFNAKDGTDAWKARAQVVPRQLLDAVHPEKRQGQAGIDRRQHGRRHQLQPGRRRGESGTTSGPFPRIRCGRWRRRSWRAAWSSPTPARAAQGRSLIALRPGGKGDVTKTNLAWEDQKSFSYVPTLLASGDYLYCVNDDGFASCHVAKTGAERSGRIGWAAT